MFTNDVRFTLKFAPSALHSLFTRSLKSCLNHFGQSVLLGPLGATESYFPQNHFIDVLVFSFWSRESEKNVVFTRVPCTYVRVLVTQDGQKWHCKADQST